MKKMTSMVVAAMALSVTSLTAFASGNVEHGKAIVEKNNCAACHGKDFNSPNDPSYPRLAGQHEDYLVQALKGYQRGNATMGAQAKVLSHEDILDVAAYLHSLPGSLVLKK